ncbi:hypothetical protein [Sphingobacterium detergens]|uniref:hypothetical protein n=1 Tax=Sphingobacterium detergens TaxID=1145106 RepID=UPI0011C3B23C|nr:hypothetical protein [Sphingobacterium detergens]
MKFPSVGLVSLQDYVVQILGEMSKLEREIEHSECNLTLYLAIRYGCHAVEMISSEMTVILIVKVLKSLNKKFTSIKCNAIFLRPLSFTALSPSFTDFF